MEEGERQVEASGMHVEARERQVEGLEMYVEALKTRGNIISIWKSHMKD